jgi:hypothetical protein
MTMAWFYQIWSWEHEKSASELHGKKSWFFLVRTKQKLLKVVPNLVCKTYSKCILFCLCSSLTWNNLLFTTPNSWKSFRKPCKKLFSGLSFHKSCFQQLFSKKTKVVFSSFFQGSEKYVRYSLNTQQVYMSNHSIWYMYSHKCVHMAATNPGYNTKFQ